MIMHSIFNTNLWFHGVFLTLISDEKSCIVVSFLIRFINHSESVQAYLYVFIAIHWFRFDRAYVHFVPRITYYRPMFDIEGFLSLTHTHTHTHTHTFYVWLHISLSVCRLVVLESGFESGQFWRIRPIHRWTRTWKQWTRTWQFPDSIQVWVFVWCMCVWHRPWPWPWFIQHHRCIGPYVDATTVCLKLMLQPLPRLIPFFRGPSLSHLSSSSLTCQPARSSPEWRNLCLYRPMAT